MNIPVQKYSLEQVNQVADRLTEKAMKFAELVPAFILNPEIEKKIKSGLDKLKHTEFDWAMEAFTSAEENFDNRARHFVKNAPEKKFGFEINRLRKASAEKAIMKPLTDTMKKFEETISGMNFDLIEAAQQYADVTAAIELANRKFRAASRNKQKKAMQKETAALLEVVRPDAVASATRFEDRLANIAKSFAAA